MNLRTSGIAKLADGVSLVWTSLCASGPGVDLCYLGHHRCATNWMRRFLRDICQIIRYNYIVLGGDRSRDISSRWRSYTFYLHVNSTVETMKAVPDQARGFHVIRDPRDVLISDYFSRRYSHGIHSPKQMELRRYLESHNLEEGLLHMIDRCAYFNQIEGWPLGKRPNILDVKYEDILADEKDMFVRIIGHLGIRIPDRTLEDIVEKSSFKVLSGGRERGEENPYHHYRKGMAGDWKNYMKEHGHVYHAFYQRYGHLTRQLGYE